ncbi:hypothetical protein [Bacillus cereus]|uniref:hypothetical protein n=1 Tax=Bacillus cereus TaxID=1396 RepID=UPI003012EF84
MNLIQNGDFSEGIHFWETNQTDNYVIQHSTGQSVMLEGNKYITQQIPIEENTTYHLFFTSHIPLTFSNTSIIHVKVQERSGVQHEFIQTETEYTFDFSNLEKQTIHTQLGTTILQIYIENPYNHPVILQPIQLEKVQSIPISKSPSVSNRIPDDSCIYYEKFQPGISTWENAIVNQSYGQGEFQEQTIGHVPFVPFQPYTQYVVAVDVKPLYLFEGTQHVTLSVFQHMNPHRILEDSEIEILPRIETWQKIYLLYRTHDTTSFFNRIALKSDVPLAFTNVSIVEIKKIFHEQFHSPVYKWNQSIIETYETDVVSVLSSNEQMYTTLQDIPFQEKKHYLATAYIRHTDISTSTSHTTSFYIEYKNIENGGFIRKPISIDVQVNQWEPIEISFLAPTFPWVISNLGFTYQGEGKLLIKEISIEEHIIQEEKEEDKQNIFDHYSVLTEEHLFQHAKDLLSTTDVNSSSKDHATCIQAASTEESLIRNHSYTFDFNPIWDNYHQQQLTFYKKKIINPTELAKIEQYINIKYKDHLRISHTEKLVDLSHLQEFDAILIAYRMDHCFQHVSPHIYTQFPIENQDIEKQIDSFFKWIPSLFASMNSSGAIVIRKEIDAPKDSKLLIYENQQLIFYQTDKHINEHLLSYLYQTYCSSLMIDFSSIDVLFHNLLYGFGLVCYEYMKNQMETMSSSSHILSDIYETEKSFFEQVFSNYFQNEQDYYATLFQLMYSPYYIYLAYAIEEQLSMQDTSFKTGFSCIRDSISIF